MNGERNTQSENVLAICKARGWAAPWNWEHPDKRNRWNTGLSPRTGDPKTRYTSMGPSKRTVARRAARARRSQ